MCSMAAFGAATAMSSMCSIAASEVGQGWGRQIAMTPLSIAGYAAVKLVTALSFSALSTAAVFLVGATTGAKADDGWRWAAVAELILAGGLIFGLSLIHICSVHRRVSQRCLRALPRLRARPALGETARNPRLNEVRCRAEPSCKM